jgi:hypothetical protein
VNKTEKKGQRLDTLATGEQKPRKKEKNKKRTRSAGTYLYGNDAVSMRFHSFAIGRRKDEEGANDAHPFHTGRDDDDSIAASDSRICAHRFQSHIRNGFISLLEKKYEKNPFRNK